MNRLTARFISALCAVSAVLSATFLLSSCTKVTTTGGSFYADCEKYSIGDTTYERGTVNTLSIDWISGDVEVIRSEGDSFSVTEQCEEGLSTESRMHWRITDKHLDIQYCESGHTFATSTPKHLTVEIPDGIDLRIAITSGNALLHEHTLKVLESTCTSGSISMDNINADSVIITSTSGNVNVNGAIKATNVNVTTTGGNIDLGRITAQQLSFSSTSGNCSVTLDECGHAAFSSTEGDIDLDLDGNGASIQHTTSSGSLTGSCFSTENGRAIYGDGKFEIEVTTVSGNLTVRE